jgi:hypothetical protein
VAQQEPARSNPVQTGLKRPCPTNPSADPTAGPTTSLGAPLTTGARHPCTHCPMDKWTLGKKVSRIQPTRPKRLAGLQAWSRTGWAMYERRLVVEMPLDGWLLPVASGPHPARKRSCRSRHWPAIGLPPGCQHSTPRNRQNIFLARAPHRLHASPSNLFGTSEGKAASEVGGGAGKNGIQQCLDTMGYTCE